LYFGVKFQNFEIITLETIFELKKHPKPKLQPSSFYFVENEFLIFDLLRVLNILRLFSRNLEILKIILLELKSLLWPFFDLRGRGPTISALKILKSRGTKVIPYECPHLLRLQVYLVNFWV
jgi:hypothetical protein